LRAASVEEIGEVAGFGPRMAAELRAFLNRPEEPVAGDPSAAEPNDVIARDAELPGS
jgi:hypothetical protein